MGKIFTLWNFVGVLAVTSMDQAFSVMFFYWQVFMLNSNFLFPLLRNKCVMLSFTLLRNLNFIPRELLFLYEKQLGLLIFFKDTYSAFLPSLIWSSE